MTLRHSIKAGRATPLGATFDGDGVNFAVFSENARAVRLCLFSADGKTEVAQLQLPERDGDVWHGFVSGLRPGQLYGYRALGPYRPDEGHRFNPNKLLIDPYARQLTGHPIWHDAVLGYRPGSSQGDLSFDSRDSAPYMPRSIVVDPAFDWQGDTAPDTSIQRSVIYEAHVKGLTAQHPAATPPGTFLGLASDPMLDYLTDLGVSAVELLPAQAFINDRFLTEKGLTNYWGYQTIGFFAPEPRYLHQGQIHEFQQMVARLHGAGIEVLMDVVYNHTGEGNQLGPTLSFRGLDNASYYRLADDRRYYINDTGTGNTVNVDHPMVLRMIMDSLRYWVEVMHVDGFRFDLCTTLGREGNRGFDRGASFFDAIRQDPVLSKVKLIAEPWDVGPGGYQLGAFPTPFLEWNDKYRDTVRRFWRKDPGLAPALADRLTGSALQFDHSGRPATSSVNLVTAHDGFTLQDVVSYSRKHNEANGEDNRDGHNEDHSDNMGHEGLKAPPEIIERRRTRTRNMLATLLLSQGTPMVLAGDELGNSQHGNNNAYCQDNELSWINWADADVELRAFARRMIAFRRAHPILGQKRFLHARERSEDGKEDLFWQRPDGKRMSHPDWEDPSFDCLCVEMRTASGTPVYDTEPEQAIFAIFNAGDARQVALPDAPDTKEWTWEIDSSRPEDAVGRLKDGTIEMPAEAVAVFVLAGAR